MLLVPVIYLTRLSEVKIHLHLPKYNTVIKHHTVKYIKLYKQLTMPPLGKITWF